MIQTQIVQQDSRLKPLNFKACIFCGNKLSANKWVQTRDVFDPCDCPQAKAERQKVIDVEKQKQKEINKRNNKIRTDRLFKETCQYSVMSKIDLADLKQDEFNKPAFDIINRVIAGLQKGVYVYSEDAGNGKTTLAFAGLNGCLIKGRKIAALSAPQMIQDLRPMSGQSQQLKAAVQERMAHVLKADLLMIDDLGKENRTPAFCQLFFNIFDNYEKRGAGMIITSNFTPKNYCSGFKKEDANANLRRIERVCVQSHNLKGGAWGMNGERK